MSLVKCSGCGQYLSLGATACQNCGAKIPSPDTQANNNSPKATIGIGLFLIIIGIGIWALYTPTAPSQITSPPTPAQQEAATDTNTAQPSILIEHHYSLKDGKEYGYEEGISEDDSKAGIKAKPLIMVRYLGAKNDTFTVQLKEGLERAILSCKSPCEFVKSKTYYDGSLIKTETMPNRQGSIIWAVMEDAQAGNLETYSNK